MKNAQKLDWVKKRKERRESQRPEILFEGIRNGDVGSLSLAITLLESSLVSDQDKAKELIRLCLPFSGNSIRIGITGVPGVGKSTFIEAFGQHVISQDKKIAVLAIDPTSQEGGGSILGDKTRMNVLSQAENAFIRPTPSGKNLGGVARKTRECILLCEAAGFDIIVVETVGVGQSETLVHSMVDFFLLLMLAGAGDELQGIKRGIMELADLLVINKADGENIKKANLAAKEYKNALHLFPPNSNEWIPKTMTCSALENENITSVWTEINNFINHTTVNGWLEKNRKNQEIHWFKETLVDNILHHFLDKKEAKEEMDRFKDLIMAKTISPFEAAEKLFTNWIKDKNK